MKRFILFALCLIIYIFTPELQPQSKKPALKDAEKEGMQVIKEEKRERPTEVHDRKDRNISVPTPVHDPPVQTRPTYTPPSDPPPAYEPAPVENYHPEVYVPVYHPDPPKRPGTDIPETPELKKQPTLFDLYTEQGIEYFDSGYYDKALIEFDNAMLIDSTEYTLYYYRGSTLLKLDYYADAISDLNIYIMYFPEDKDAFYNRGLAWFYMDNKTIAYEDFKAASVLGDKRAKAILKRFY